MPRGERNKQSRYQQLLREAERKLLRDTLEYTGGNFTEAGAMLGVSDQLIADRAKMLGGVLEGDPVHEPYHHNDRKAALAAQKRAERAQRRNQRHPTEVAAGGEDQPTNASERAPDGANAQQEVAGDQRDLAS